MSKIGTNSRRWDQGILDSAKPGHYHADLGWC